MKVQKITKNHKHYPAYLKEITYPPKELYLLGQPLIDYLPAATIVGARKLSTYGQAITHQLAYDLARAGITIISGLALGADGVAHRAALEAGGRTMAVLAGGLDKIYPASHRNLAIDILRSGGSLLSEYPEGMPSLKQHFIARNRLVTGLSDIVIITEAAEKSGSLVSASYGVEQNKLVGAVPGPVTAGGSQGTNSLLKSGAHVITDAQDVLDLLGIKAKQQSRAEVMGDTPEEQAIIDLLKSGVSSLEDLQEKSGLDPSVFSQTMTMLEIAGKIRPTGSAHWTLS